MHPSVVFDVDGVLADTADLSREAYRLAGADPPHDGIPWQEWLPAQVGNDAAAIHAAKTHIYAELLDAFPPEPTPASYLAHDLLYGGAPTYAVTAASAVNVRAVLAAVGLGELPLLAVELPGALRPELLVRIAPTGVYLDDRIETIDLVDSTTRWRAIHVGSPRLTLPELRAVVVASCR